jgi:hypothetical protein
LVVLLGYWCRLAPSVTFWDAGEFVSAMKILGIPHRPGRRLFVMMGHIWGTIFPFGEFAFRTQFPERALQLGGGGMLVPGPAGIGGAVPRRNGASRPGRAPDPRGAAGTLIAAFGFTNWLNSNETEVYAVATFTIAAVCWLLFRWRATRSTERAPRYCCWWVLPGHRIGNHLLGLLVGPAAVAFVVAELGTGRRPIRHAPTRVGLSRRPGGALGPVDGYRAR